MNGKRSATRRNVVVVVADQLRRSAIGVYGDPNVATPHMDALANRGTRFANASSSYPVCVPFRFTLMTGEPAHTRWVPSIDWRMSPCERTIADSFNSAGFDTAYFGKWHLYGASGVVPGHTPLKANRIRIPRQHQGRWQQFWGFEYANLPFDTVYFRNDDPTSYRISGYQSDGLFDLAIDYVQDRASDPRPFLCMLSVEPPHPPFVAPPVYMQRWADREIELPGNVDVSKGYQLRAPGSAGLLDEIRGYYAAIENLDDNVGRLVSALSSAGISEETVLLITSDHGELLGCHGLTGKCFPYEESVGVPLIVAGPGVPQTVVHAPVHTEDLFPTILGLGGVDVPSTPGCNLMAASRDRALEERRGVVLQFVAEFRSGFAFHDKTWRAIRTERFKYSVLGDAYGASPWQFFDLEHDPLELDNLVDSWDHRDVIAEHHALLLSRLESQGDAYVLKPAFGQPGLNTWYDPSVNAEPT